MPAGGPSGNPFRNQRMQEAALKGYLITLRCALCSRSAHFWAADLVRVVGDHQLHIPPFPCSRCRTKEHLSVSWTIPSAGTLHGLTVRRPVRKVERWIWRDERA